MFWNRESQVIILLIGISLMLFFTLQFLVNNLYSTGINLDKTKQQITTLRHENMGLNNHLLDLESYHYIEQQAKNEGFRPAVFVTP